MSTILKLLRLQIDNKYDFFRKTKRKTFKTFGGYAIIFCLVLGLVYFLGRQVITYLQINMNQHFFGIVLVVAQAVSLIFGMTSVLKNLYMSKENELLIIFPASFNQLYLSKILILYISELIFNLIYIVPILMSFGAIALSAGYVGMGYFLGVVLLLPFLPILPLALAVIISIPVMYLIKFLKKRQTLSTIFILATVVLVFVMYMGLVPKITGAFNIAEKQMETSFKVNLAIRRIGGKIPIYFWLSNSLKAINEFYRIPIYILITLGMFVVATIIIKPFFKSIILSGNEATQIKGRKKPFRVRNQFLELLITQFRMLFRSPNYVFDFLLFPLLMPIITIMYDKLLFTIVVNQMGKGLIIGSHVLVISIITLISSSISSTAISRDGAMTYFVKSSPVSYNKQTFVKILVNLIINFISLTMTTILCLVLKIGNPLIMILASISVFILSIGHVCQAYDWDLRNPSLKWYDSSEIQSVNKNTTKTITLGIVLSLIVFLIMSLLYHNLIIGLLAVMLIGIIYAVARIYLLYYRINYYYMEMEI